jgi:DNA-binding SARP family transcriptional activator/TolB-like protein
MAPVSAFATNPGPGPQDAPKGARLAISIFGGVGVAVGGQELRLPNRKGRALLAYLATSDVANERRERLAGLLWPDSSEENARASLRQVLQDVREALAAADCNVMVAGRQEVGLRNESVDLDLAMIRRELAAGRAPDALIRQPRAADTVLLGYEDISPLFQDWVHATRARVQEELVRGLEQGCENNALPRRQRRFLAEALLMVEPLHEAACRTVMRLAAEDGEIGFALRAYANLYEVLAEELDMEPSAATQELVAEIKQGKLDPVVEPPREAGLPGAASGALGEERRGGISPSAAAWSSRPSIAVLPFTEYGSPASDSLIGEGIAEDAIAMLTALPDLLVISRNSTQKYRGVSLDIPAIGRELGVRYICSGTVRRQGNRLRVSAELADAESLAVVAAARFQGEITDLFSLQDRITEHILQAIAPHIRHAELQRARNKRTENLDAYDYMLRGSDLLYRLDRAQFERARELLQRSMELDPNYAAPRAFTALWHSLRVNQGWSPDRPADLARVDEFVAAALRCDPNDVWALSLSGHLRALLFRDFDAAFDLFERALRAGPNSAFAWARSSPAFSYIGNGAEGRRRAEEALRRSPLDPHVFFTQGVLAMAAYTEQDYADAIAWGRRSYAENPKHTPCLRFLAASLAATGRVEEARQMAEALHRLEPRFRVREFCANYAYRDEQLRDRFARHLLAAGLPE